MLYDFELANNVAEETKNISYVKGEWQSWSQYSNQIVEEISLLLQQPRPKTIDGWRYFASVATT